MSHDSRLLGVAVASGSNSVGDRVPHAMPRVGLIATQAYTNVAYGVEGLKLLSKKVSPKEVLDKLLVKDPYRELRQVAIMDFKGRKAVHTGVKAPEYHGEIVGEDYIIIGNLLAGEEVLRGMAIEFKSSCGDLAWRIIKTLKAGSEMGGDRRGEKSAAVIVVSAKKKEVNLRVDMHVTPFEELSHILK